MAKDQDTSIKYQKAPNLKSQTKHWLLVFENFCSLLFDAWFFF